MTAAIGLDVGKTRLDAAVVASGGRVARRATRETDLAGGADAVLGQCRDLVDGLVDAADRPLAGIGVASTGTVDPDRGVLVSSGSIDGWADIPLAERYADRYGLPVTVENDVVAAAVGEARYGSAVDAEVAVYLVLATGVGAATVVDGEPWRGTHRVAGQVAHLPLFGDRTVNDVLGGRGIARRYAEVAGDADADAAAAFDAAAAGDPDAERVVSAAVDAGGALVAWLQTTVDPAAFVVGGGVASGRPAFVDRIEAAARDALAAYAGALDGAPTLVTPDLGDRAGLVGAASRHL